MLSLKPFHGETRPSSGINVYEEIGKCFACGESFNLAKLVAHCNDFVLPRGEYDFARAYMWLEEKYNLEKKTVYKKKLGIRRIEDEDLEEEEETPTRHEMSKIKLAVFKSGKAVHDYFFTRGFTKETAKKFLIGWDSKRMRITIPVLWEDEVPCGVIGRAVLEMKKNGKPNPEFYKIYKKGNDFKYHIYDNFPVGDILYPLPFFKPIDDTAVLVEGQFDAMWGHQQGFPQFLSSLGSKLAFSKKEQRSKQVDLLLSLGVRKVILLRDLDEAGIKGAEHDYKLLRQAGIIVYGTDFPEGKSDPQELTKEEIKSMIDNKYLYNIGTSKIKRIDD